VSAIAYQVGFGDLSYFNRCFRQRYGVTSRRARSGKTSQDEKARPFIDEDWAQRIQDFLRWSAA